MPNSPACRAGKDPPSPFFSPGLYRWITRSSKNPSRVLYSSVDARFHELCTSCRRHVGHIATGSTCQAPNNSAEQQGDAPHSYRPSSSNEQWDVKSQCRTFPDGRSNHYFTLRFAIISNHVVLLLPQEGHAHRLGTSWHVGPHDRPCSPADRSVKSPHFYYYTSSVSVYMACTSF